MKRLVYLYELDSVRNSKKEIVLGQQALFEDCKKRKYRSSFLQSTN